MEADVGLRNRSKTDAAESTESGLYSTSRVLPNNLGESLSPGELPNSARLGFSSGKEEEEEANHLDEKGVHQGESSDSFQQTVGKVMLSVRMETMVAVVILLNCVMIIIETDKEAQCYPEHAHDLKNCPHAASNHAWMVWCQNAFMALYTIEALLMIYVLRLEYFRRPLYLFDFVICVGGWGAVFLDGIINISYFRILRCLRLFKAFRFIGNVPELYKLFNGLLGAMKTIFFGAIFLMALLVFSSILLVQLVHPANSEITYKNCDRCHRGFATVLESVLTLFQTVVAKDSWGEISIPVIEQDKIGIVLMIVQLLIGIGLMNLILAVVVESVVEARMARNEQGLNIKARTQRKRKNDLLDSVQQMCSKKDGTIDRAEVLQAAKNSSEFQERLKYMGMTFADLEQIIDAADDENPCCVSYVELSNALSAMETDDTRKSVVLLKMNLMCLRRDIFAKFESQNGVLNEIKNEIKDHVSAQSAQRTSRRTSRHSGIASQNLGEVTLEDALHKPQTCPECKAAMRFIEPQIACETSLLQKSLRDLDLFWSNAVGMAEQASAFCTSQEKHQPRTQGKNLPFCKPFAKYVAEQLGETKYVVEQLSETQRNSLRRQSVLFQGIVTDLEQEVECLIKHCKVFSDHDMRAAETSPRPPGPRPPTSPSISPETSKEHIRLRL